jgi:hypothetical protein
MARQSNALASRPSNLPSNCRFENCPIKGAL